MNYFCDKFWCLSRSCVTGVSQRPVSGRAETHNLARTKGCHGETGEKEDGTMVHPGTGQPNADQQWPLRAPCAPCVRVRRALCTRASSVWLFPPVMSSWIGKDGVYWEHENEFDIIVITDKSNLWVYTFVSTNAGSALLTYDLPCTIDTGW